MKMHLIAPSLLAADFTRLSEEINMVNTSEADWFHLDVMDGRFVPNITFGMFVIKAIKKIAVKPLDVHLMIVEPERYIESFRDAGADVITVHYEACIHLHRTIQLIKSTGAKVGVALNPHTPVAFLEDCISDIDVVCLMSVNPGFGGQTFIPQTYEKIRKLKQLIKKYAAQTLIEIDGGVGMDNYEKLIKEGADILVAGSSVFGADSPMDRIGDLKRINLRQ